MIKSIGSVPNTHVAHTTYLSAVRLPSICMYGGNTEENHSTFAPSPFHKANTKSTAIVINDIIECSAVESSNTKAVVAKQNGRVFISSDKKSFVNGLFSQIAVPQTDKVYTQAVSR